MKKVINDSWLPNNNGQFKEINYEIDSHDFEKLVNIIKETVSWIISFNWKTTLIKAYKNKNI